MCARTCLCRLAYVTRRRDMVKDTYCTEIACCSSGRHMKIRARRPFRNFMPIKCVIVSFKHHLSFLNWPFFIVCEGISFAIFASLLIVGTISVSYMCIRLTTYDSFFGAFNKLTLSDIHSLRDLRSKGAIYSYPIKRTKYKIHCFLLFSLSHSSSV